MKDLWYERSVGIKLRGFDTDPHELASNFNVLSESNAKGDAHGAKNTYKENQIHFLNVLERGDSWDDGFIELVKSFGGVENLKLILNSISPKQVLVIVNMPISDLQDGHSNDLSIESLKAICEIDCNISFNFF